MVKINLADDFRLMETLDPANAETYKSSGQFEILSWNRHFWFSYFQVQRKPNYYFSAKMCSEPFQITLGTDLEKYWCPFPGVEAYPIIISFNTVSEVAQTIQLFLGKN